MLSGCRMGGRCSSSTSFFERSFDEHQIIFASSFYCHIHCVECVNDFIFLFFLPRFESNFTENSPTFSQILIYVCYSSSVWYSNSRQQGHCELTIHPKRLNLIDRLAISILVLHLTNQIRRSSSVSFSVMSTGVMLPINRIISANKSC